MTENELRAQIRDELLSEMKFETFRNASIVTAICVTVVVDDGKNPPAHAVCRFYLPNGLFVGEVPANSDADREEFKRLVVPLVEFIQNRHDKCTPYSWIIVKKNGAAFMPESLWCPFKVPDSDSARL